MKLKVTVHADKRYYLDEQFLCNGESITDTITRFNDIKMHLYNCLYDQRFLGKDPFDGKSYDYFLKEHYHMNSYYNCCIYTSASGMISSQKELNHLYQETAKQDISTRKDKTASVSETLEKKEQIKSSIRTYCKTGKWVKPYPKCALRVHGQQISIQGKTHPLDEYERKVEDDIRDLKNRLGMLQYGLSRKERILEDLSNHPPKRIVFGTKELYREKDSADTAVWKEEFHFRRHASMSLPGRHTSASCNFLAYLSVDGLHVRCMDGNETAFKDFHLSRYQDQYLSLLAAKSTDRKAVCYNFQLHKDKAGRTYIIPSVTMELENEHANSGFANGCVAIDQNWDNITLSDIAADGTCKMHKTIPFQLEGKTSGQISNIIGNVMAEVGDYCKQVQKCLVIEDIDTTLKRNGLRYGSRKRNRHVSLFAYRKITACAYNQGFQKDFEVYTVNPAYTSQIAKVRYMRKMGCAIHEAASYTIGLKAMGMDNLLAPPKLIISLLPQKVRESESIWKQWQYITKRFRGVRTHLFYGHPPDKELAAYKKPTLASYAKILKDRDVSASEF